MPEKLILRDWRQIRAWLEPRLEDVQLISLDIFDTLLGRYVGDPVEVQRAVCRAVSQHTGIAAETVWQARQQAEQALRSEAVQAGFDHECRYSDLLLRWVECLLSTTLREREEGGFSIFHPPNRTRPRSCHAARQTRCPSVHGLGTGTTDSHHCHVGYVSGWRDALRAIAAQGTR